MVRRIYLWERAGWPGLAWDAARLLEPLAQVRRRQGLLAGLAAALPEEDRRTATLETLTDDALETSDIEGEALSRVSVRSSVARRLGYADDGRRDPRAEAIAALTVDATTKCREPLTIERLHRWHASLFASTSAGFPIGGFRRVEHDPMQVISGPYGHQVVHFEAPPAERVPSEMAAFMQWLERGESVDGLLRAAHAHLWFLTIHPYGDGNGRIGRAIADMLLARDEGGEDRYVSMSRQINAEKRAYYDAAERAQRGTTDVTAWMLWFLACYGRAIDRACTAIAQATEVTALWRAWEARELSARQRAVLRRVLAPDWQGLLTAKKWAALVNTSPDTALRDITDLVAKGILVKSTSGSKNTHYDIVR